MIEVIRTDSTLVNTVAIQRAGSDTINGGNSVLVSAQYESAGVRDAASAKAYRVY